MEFNFNRFANRGASLVKGDHLLICNNDLVFHHNSIDILHEHAVDLQLSVVCPVCPLDPYKKQRDMLGVEIGTEIGRHFTGWCFMIRRDTYEAIGGFDEDFPFWYADNAVMEQLKALNIFSTVLPTALVEHRTSSTLKTLKRPERLKLTKQQRARFEAKYGTLPQS
jgi:hypothetical protein